MLRKGNFAGTQTSYQYFFTEFEEQLCTFDIELIASGPGKPQNQGKVERWHRTYREEFEKKIVRFESMAQAQLETTQFVNYYNYERPHQGIRGLFPADRFFGISEELEKELAMYRSGRREKECIYFCCNINGKKIGAGSLLELFSRYFLNCKKGKQKNIYSVNKVDPYPRDNEENIIRELKECKDWIVHKPDLDMGKIQSYTLLQLWTIKPGIEKP